MTGSGRPLRVVSVQTSNEQGGGEYANVNLLERLQGRGFDVQLVSNQPELVHGTSVPCREIDIGPKLARRNVRRFALSFPVWTRRLRAVLADEARRAPIDVLLLHYKKEQLMGPFLGRVADRIVWAEWGPLPHQFERGPIRAAYARAARGTERIVAISGGTKRSLVDAGVDEQRITVVPNIVDGSVVRFDESARARLRQEWGATDDTFVIGCISRYNGKKRNDVVIDSIRHLDGDVLLVIAGDGPDEDNLRTRAADLGKHVRFIPTPRGYVQEVLSACDVQAFAGQSTEGSPRAIVFGQLTERPVVACDTPGAEDMLPPGGVIASPHNDAAALARELQRYREQPELRVRDGKAGRAHAIAHYDPDRVLDRWIEELEGAATPR